MPNNITITKQTLTQSVDYQYTVPEKCISIALQADGDLLMNVAGSSSTWKITDNRLETFDGNDAMKLRGENFVFNASGDTTASTEIRSIQ